MNLKKKNLTFTIHIPPRKAGPLSMEESKQLVEFFEAILDLRPEDDAQRENHES